MVYMYNWTLFSFKKEGKADISDTMNEAWGHYMKSNKPVIEEQVQYDSIYMRYFIFFPFIFISWRLITLQYPTHRKIE